MLGRERAEVRLIWVDVGDDATIPDDADEAALRDLVHDPPVTRAQTRRACVVGNQFDPRADRDTRLDSGRKKTCAKWVHDAVIGSARGELDLRRMTEEEFRRQRRFRGRRAVPNSTA